jgi:hypothetical protein
MRPFTDLEILPDPACKHNPDPIYCLCGQPSIDPLSLVTEMTDSIEATVGYDYAQPPTPWLHVLRFDLTQDPTPDFPNDPKKWGWTVLWMAHEIGHVVRT